MDEFAPEQFIELVVQMVEIKTQTLRKVGFGATS